MEEHRMARSLYYIIPKREYGFALIAPAILSPGYRAAPDESG
jgi:hypothetical protein